MHDDTLLGILFGIGYLFTSFERIIWDGLPVNIFFALALFILLVRFSGELKHELVQNNQPEKEGHASG